MEEKNCSNFVVVNHTLKNTAKICWTSVTRKYPVWYANELFLIHQFGKTFYFALLP